MFGFSRVLVIYAIAIPLALMLGYSSSLFDPANGGKSTFEVAALVMFVLVLPLLLQWNRPILFFCWNAIFVAAFLPGQPELWMLMVFFSLLVVIVQRGLNPKFRLLAVPSVAWPAAALALVVLVTAEARGGIGAHSLGSSMLGGRKYLWLLCSIVGYFALSCQEIPRKRAALYASCFFLSGVTEALGELPSVAGSHFGWLYYLISNKHSIVPGGAESAAEAMGYARFSSLPWATLAFCCFMLVRYGIKGILDMRHPWRLALLCLAFVAGLFGGFRGQFVLVAMLFVVQFFLEGLWRTWLLPVAVGLVVVCAAVVVGFSDRLPEGVQRSLSFLPVKIDPAVLENAESTTRWRLDLWQEVADQIPKYFWLGKGYGYSENDLYASGQMVGSRMAESYEFYITTSDFHSGPLSVLIPFGVFGCIAFLWFLGAGWWALWCNYRNGDPELRLINTFLLAYFTVRGLFFLTVFGALDSEFAVFAGAVGLSVALNRGVRKRAAGAVAGHEGKPAPRPAIFPRPVAGLYAGGRPFHTRGAARARALVPAKVYYRAKLE